MGGECKKISLLLKQFHDNFRSKPRKLGLFSEMQNDVIMHREGLKG